jgi:hypothetical protein
MIVHLIRRPLYGKNNKDTDTINEKMPLNECAKFLSVIIKMF